MDPTEAPVGPRRSMTERMMGAAKLDISVYEEVEHDATATAQAAGVVGIVALCSAIGSIGSGLGAAAGGLVAAYVGWAVWSAVTYVIGDKVFGGTATWGELLRTIGFAQTPGVLYLIGVIPFVGWLVYPVVWVWLLVAGIVAIRQALDFSTGKAVLTALLGMVAYVVVAATLAVLTGVAGAVG